MTTDANQIDGLLPHRPPMLLLDEITMLQDGVRITAQRRLSADEPWYASRQGAAAGPYPPVLLLESWCQAAACLLATCATGSTPAELMLFAAASGVTFHTPAAPGELVEHRVSLVRLLEETAIVDGDAVIGGRRVLSVEQAIIAIRPKQGLVAADTSPPGVTQERPLAAVAAAGTAEDVLR